LARSRHRLRHRRHRQGRSVLADRRAAPGGPACGAHAGTCCCMSAIDDLPPLREVIRRHGLKARKSLGQNFLLDLNLTARIARAGGALAGVTVVAIERDARAIAALDEIAARYPGRLAVVAGDALELDPRPQVGAGPARIIAN